MFEEPLFYSEVPEAHGCAFNIQSPKRLNIEKKTKIEFSFFVSEKRQGQLFQSFLDLDHLVALSGGLIFKSRPSES